MEDYIFYIDFQSLELGDLAFKIGDYNCARQNYSKVLRRLQYYQGDSMVAINMAADLQKKLRFLNSEFGNSNNILVFERWPLSKSSFVKGNQCIKYLYLDKFNKRDRTPHSSEKQALLKKGHSFEDQFRLSHFPDGINIKEVVGNFAYFNSYTKYVLRSNESMVLYEATIIEEEVLIMVDVLVKNENHSFDFYDVKLSTELNSAIINDLALQYYICKQRFKDAINTFNIVLRDPQNN